MVLSVSGEPTVGNQLIIQRASRTIKTKVTSATVQETTFPPFPVLRNRPHLRHIDRERKINNPWRRLIPSRPTGTSVEDESLPRLLCLALQTHHRVAQEETIRSFNGSCIQNTRILIAARQRLPLPSFVLLISTKIYPPCGPSTTTKAEISRCEPLRMPILRLVLRTTMPSGQEIFGVEQRLMGRGDLGG
jgi:hypothetical protein